MDGEASCVYDNCYGRLQYHKRRHGTPQGPHQKTAREPPPHKCGEGSEAERQHKKIDGLYATHENKLGSIDAKT